MWWILGLALLGQTASNADQALREDQGAKSDGEPLVAQRTIADSERREQSAREIEALLSDLYRVDHQQLAEIERKLTDSPNAELFNQHGRILWNAGRRRDALDAWQSALEVSPNNMEALERLIRGGLHLDEYARTEAWAIELARLDRDAAVHVLQKESRMINRVMDALEERIGQLDQEEAAVMQRAIELQRERTNERIRKIKAIIARIEGYHDESKESVPRSPP